MTTYRTDEFLAPALSDVLNDIWGLISTLQRQNSLNSSGLELIGKALEVERKFGLENQLLKSVMMKLEKRTLTRSYTDKSGQPWSIEITEENRGPGAGGWTVIDSKFTKM